MDPAAFLDRVRSDPGAAACLVEVRELPARPQQGVPFPDDLPEQLVARLKHRGIDNLHTHQREGIERLSAGRNVVMATGTASGKSLVYQAAIVKEVIDGSKATALLLFPTKALARDQLRSLRSLALPQVKAAVYDGDTPVAERPLIRARANAVVSNPDMLHLSLLPDHGRWADFLHRLSLVVVDEAHVLRGVFGSQVALIMRRLRRLIARYGAEPRWCLSTATVGDPGDLAETLTGLPFDVIDEDGAPRGRRVFALWNPPVLDDRTGARRSALTDAARLMIQLVDGDTRTIGFTRSRRASELLAEFTRRGVDAAQTRERIKTYRAGYLPEERRKLEAALASGELLGVASTSALELGIDVGSFDAAILTGYPGTRASLWQQAGRAGRSDDPSLAILVAQDDPLDQHLVTHPEELFDQPPEDAVVDPTNPYVVRPHLRCAARESPLSEEEVSTYFGPAGDEALTALVAEGTLTQRPSGLLHDTTSSDPHREVDVRAGGGHTYRIVLEATGELLGTSDEHRAFATLHPGAVYLHQGEQFLVRELDLVGRAALVQEADPDFSTHARAVTDVRILRPLQERRMGDVALVFGEVGVTDQVVAFARRSVATGETMGEEPLSLPPVTLETRSVWWVLPEQVFDKAGIDASELAGAIHAAEHAAIGLLPLVATCDRWDVGGMSTPLHADTRATTIFVYDGYPGGSGLSERGFRHADRWLGATLERIRTCPCRDGCPSCVVSPKCGNGNEPLDKRAACALLAGILDPSWR